MQQKTEPKVFFNVRVFRKQFRGLRLLAIARRRTLTGVFEELLDRELAPGGRRK